MFRTERPVRRRGIFIHPVLPVNAAADGQFRHYRQTVAGEQLDAGTRQVGIHRIAFIVFSDKTRRPKGHLPVIGNRPVDFELHPFADGTVDGFIGCFAVAAGDLPAGRLAEVILLNAE